MPDKLTPMFRFTVKRSKWLRGEGSDSSFLLRHKDDKMCCLGFAALACGHSDKEIRHIKTPNEMEERRGFMNQLILDNDDPEETDSLEATDLCDSIMDRNDNEDLRDSEREAELKELFAELGVEIIFVD